MIHLEPDEKIILTVQKHWFIYTLEGLFLLGLVVIPIVFGKFLLELQFIHLSGDSFFLFIFASSLWFLVCWIIFFIVWTNNYLDALIVTNKRLIDIEQLTLFSRDTSSYRLDKIQDITVEVHGVMATFLSYGNILIETAGETRQLRINTVPNPQEIKNKILGLYQTSVDKPSASQPPAQTPTL